MLGAALSQAWPPFVLVAALLVLGAVAHRDGLFTALGALLESAAGPLGLLFGAGCVLLALTTALLNLDTAVVFVTPVLVMAARHRGAAQRPFLYAALFMANASSLYLPGSNLTNLLVLHDGHAGGPFAGPMFLAALAATVVTAAGLALVHWRELGGPGPRAVSDPPAGGAGAGGAAGGAAGGSGRLGGLGALAAAVLMVLFRNPALPVAGVALIVGATALVRERVAVGQLVEAVSPAVLAAIFAVAVGLGVLARAWSGPAQLLAGAGRWETAGIAAGATVVINNLPAAVMLSAHAVPHPRALLIGLNIGPNLAITGSLAAFLWLRTARQLEVQASVVRVSAIGIVLAPLAIAAALAASSG